MEISDNCVYYPVTCSCGFEGKEWYALNFIEITSNIAENKSIETYLRKLHTSESLKRGG